MATQYVHYPKSGGSSGSSGSQTGVAYIVGPLDGASANAQGGFIGSFTFYQQSATITFPGLVSSASQSFSGVKAFTNGLRSTSVTVGSITLTSSTGGSSYSLALPGTIVGSLTMLANDGLGGLNWVGPYVLGSSTTNNFTLARFTNSNYLTGSGVTLTNANNISGVSSFNCSFITVGAAGTAAAPPLTLADGTAGFYRASLNNISITSSSTQTVSISSLGTRIVTGSLSAAYLQVSSPVKTDGSGTFVTGSISLATDVTGTLPFTSITGSVSLTNQVSGVLPVLNGGTGVSNSTIVIGSITHSQTAGGATYAIAWPAAQGGSNTVAQNDGSGNLTWAAALANPMTATGDIIVGSASGAATKLVKGSDGALLTTDSSTSLAVKWGTILNNWNPQATSGSWLANTIYTGIYKRVGDTLWGQVYILLQGAPTSAVLNVQLPGGLAIDSTKIAGAITNNVWMGSGTASDTGAAEYGVDVMYIGSNSSLRIKCATDGVTGFQLRGNDTVNQAQPFTFGSSDFITFIYQVPVVGWT